MTDSNANIGLATNQPSMTRRKRLLKSLERLDGAMAAAARTAWATIVEGFVAYGMAECGEIVDLTPRQPVAKPCRGNMDLMSEDLLAMRLSNDASSRIRHDALVSSPGEHEQPAPASKRQVTELLDRNGRIL
jgi:hypothetical protein